MNTYKRAIEKSEIIDFFRGVGEYFDLDKERGNHNITTTTYNIFGLRTELGEEKLYEQLNNDLAIYLETNNLNVQDLIVILNVFWLYNQFIEDNILKLKWRINIEIIKKIHSMIKEFESNNLDLKNVNSIIKRLEERFNFTLK